MININSSHEAYVRSIDDKYSKLLEEVEKEAEILGVDVPVIVAVSKTKPIEMILAAWDVGIRDFGENYAQEFEQKALELPDATWHFIGHLQRRNIKYVIPHVNYLHTLDSIKLANKLSNKGFDQEIFVEVNISGDETKHGLENNVTAIKNFVNQCKELGLKVTGLMAMGGKNWTDEETLNGFLTLQNYANDIGLKKLSIGMTADWKLAMRAGATHLRIGTAIFGPRPCKNDT